MSGCISSVTPSFRLSSANDSQSLITTGQFRLSVSQRTGKGRHYSGIVNEYFIASLHKSEATHASALTMEIHTATS